MFSTFLFFEIFFLLWYFVLINQIEGALMRGAFDGELKNMGFYKMVEKTTRQTIKWLV